MFKLFVIKVVIVDRYADLGLDPFVFLDTVILAKALYKLFEPPLVPLFDDRLVVVVVNLARASCAPFILFILLSNHVQTHGSRGLPVGHFNLLARLDRLPGRLDRFSDQYSLEQGGFVSTTKGGFEIVQLALREDEQPLAKGREDRSGSSLESHVVGGSSSESSLVPASGSCSRSDSSRVSRRCSSPAFLDIGIKNGTFDFVQISVDIGSRSVNRCSVFVDRRA